MKTTLLLAALLLSPIPLALAAPDSATAHLTVNAGTPGAPAWRECDLTVPLGANVGDLLDRAVATGCILEWSSATFAGYGRYVTSIDHVPGAFATYWAFYVDGEYAEFGIDSTQVAPGSTYQFTYEQWVVPL